jgi:branched-chain amino acid transport system ATP-binding protein
MSDVLRVENIETAYGSSQVLFGVSFTIRQGEVATLLGRNGVGKTTILRSVLGLAPVLRGTIHFRGRRIDALSTDRIARLGIAIVPEGRQIFPNLTVKENLVAFADNRSESRNPWTLAKVYELFPRLQQRAHHMGNHISGGEQQMLAIGRALMTNPHLLILDEATEGLSLHAREEIWACLGGLREQGQTILVVDKYVERLLSVADRHSVIARGRVVWSGGSGELRQMPDLWHRYVGL